MDYRQYAQLVRRRREFGDKGESKLSMDGNGRAIDNVFIERLWGKYEHIYLFPLADGLKLYFGLKQWFCDYNTDHRYTALDGELPEKVYSVHMPQKPKAA